MIRLINVMDGVYVAPADVSAVMTDVNGQLSVTLIRRLLSAGQTFNLPLQTV